MRSLQRVAFLLVSAVLLSLIVGRPVAARSDDEKKAGHDAKPPVYEVDFHDEGGKAQTKEFDCSKHKDTDELMGLIVAGQAHEMRKKDVPTLSKIFSLGSDLGIWTLVIFGLLFLILRQKAWPMMLEGLQKREQGIRSAIDEAHKAREETGRLRDEVVSERAKAAEDARATIEEARRDALKQADELKAKALEDIRAERDRMRRDLEIARDAALEDLWGRTVQLATLVSGRAIGRHLSAEDHKDLVDQAIADLRSASAERKREIAGV
jgi:F-type H+-transporting ATPase subunit b